jgi:DNA-binding NarL/FixJ family response regulator
VRKAKFAYAPRPSVTTASVGSWSAWVRKNPVKTFPSPDATPIRHRWRCGCYELGRVQCAPGLLGLAEPLTGREVEVLRLLAAGKSNQQIADELVVTLATVKKHVGHILGKLAAANRAQAVARARVLGLLR